MILVGDMQSPCASSVAAGVINPVTGRWAVKTWRINDLIPEAEACYRELEATFDICFYHPIPLRRFCQNSDDLKRIGRRLRNPRYADVLGKMHAAGDSPAAIRDEYGSFDILQASYVDIPPLLATLRKFFSCHDLVFEHGNLSRERDLWRYNEFAAKQVIFCEGAGVQNNPWFADIPMTPVKGETLLVEYPGLQLPRAIYHHRKWILPYDDNSFRIGATYKDDFRSAAPTASGAKELLEGAQAFLGSEQPLKVIKHLAGVRPCTADARPIMGPHPDEPELYLFNGLGSKGASLTPLLSRHFVEYLLHQHPLDPEVALNRF